MSFVARFRKWRDLRADPEWCRGRKSLLTDPPEQWTTMEWTGWKARQRAAVRGSERDMAPWNRPNYVQGQGLHARKLCWCPTYGGRRWDDVNAMWVCETCGHELILDRHFPHFPSTPRGR